MRLLELMDLLGGGRAGDRAARPGHLGQDAVGTTASQGGAGFASSSGHQVPWDQHAPWSTRNDTDGDGVIDALDTIFGPGA